MTPERYNAIAWDQTEELTQEEFNAGWHFCDEFDGLLVGPETTEMEYCTCECVDEHDNVFKPKERAKK